MSLEILGGRFCEIKSWTGIDDIDALADLQMRFLYLRNFFLREIKA